MTNENRFNLYTFTQAAESFTQLHIGQFNLQNKGSHKDTSQNMTLTLIKHRDTHNYPRKHN